MAGYLRWAAWAGVITLAMADVFERLRLTMRSVSVVLFTLGGGRSTVWNFYLVRRAIGSS